LTEKSQTAHKTVVDMHTEFLHICGTAVSHGPVKQQCQCNIYHTYWTC